MPDQHCPGFESNKSLNEVKLKCPTCGKEWEVFSDEIKKDVRCAGCGATFDPNACGCSCGSK